MRAGGGGLPINTLFHSDRHESHINYTPARDRRVGGDIYYIFACSHFGSRMAIHET